MIPKLTVTDIESFSYDGESLTVSFNIPHERGSVSYTETLAWGPDFPPQHLKVITSDFLHTLVDCVNGHYQPSYVSPCKTCTSACCRNWDVNVGIEDVLRLREAGQQPETMINLWDEGSWEDFYELVDAGESPVVAIDGSVGLLKMIPWQGKEGETACVNLSPDGTGCRVYEHRPRTCRAFRDRGCERYEEDPAKRAGRVQLRVHT